MTLIEPAQLLARGEATLVSSWAAYASGIADAAVHLLEGVTVAAFPSGAERIVYNNALLARELDAAARRSAVDLMEEVYAAARIDRYAAWVHESDAAMRDLLACRGYVVETSTLAMGVALDALPTIQRTLTLGTLAWIDYIRIFDLPDGLHPYPLDENLRLFVAFDGSDPVTSGLSFDYEGDCGIYNVGTVERARRRGFGTALSLLQLHLARDRGCTTASLQSTVMAESVYAAAGFKPLGRYLEFVRA